MARKSSVKERPGELSLWIRPSKDVYALGEAIVIRYLLENRMDREVFVVDGREYCRCVKDPDAVVCDPKDERCTLKCYIAEVPMPPTVDFNSYYPPPLRCLGAGDSYEGQVVVCMPRRETIRTERNEIREIVVPMANQLGLMVAVGYGLSDYPRKVGAYGIVQDFLAWQKIVESDVASVTIA